MKRDVDSVCTNLYNGQMHTSDNRITFRCPPLLLKKLEATVDKRKSPYAPTKTALILRGIELALKEFDRKR